MKSASASPFWLARARIPTTARYATVPASELIRACADGEAVAWVEFMRRFHRIIAITAYRAARRWGGDSALTDDLAQETYFKLCADGARVLREFDSPHPDAIFAFLKVVTANVANDYFKRLHAGKRGGSQIGQTLEDAAPTGSAAGQPVEREALLGEVDACLCAVAPAETKVLDSSGCTTSWA